MWVKHLHVICELLAIAFSNLALSQSCFVELEATNFSQTLSSPNWPQKYDSNHACEWIITTSSKMKIEISFLEFSLEDSHDYLAIYDEDNNETRFSGSPCINEFYQPAYISATNYVRLVFTSDADLEESGFQISYRTTNESDNASRRAKLVQGPLNRFYFYPFVVNVVVYDDPSSLLPFGWPIRDDPDGENQTYTWRLLAPDNRSINISFLLFQTELCCDYMMMWDGGVPVFILQGSICPKPYISTTSNVTFQFRYDESYQDEGFIIQFQLANITDSTDGPTPTITRGFIKAATAKVLENRENCQPNGSIQSDNADVFLWFPYEKETCESEESAVCLSCNLEAAIENLKTILADDDLQVDEMSLSSVVHTISQVLEESHQRQQIYPDSDDVIDDKKTTDILTILNNFARKAGSDLQQNSSADMINFTNTAEDVSVQILSIAPLTPSLNENSGDQVDNADFNYPDATLKLYDRRSNSTVVMTIPAETVAEVVQETGNPHPVFFATMVGKIKFSSSNISISQIVTVGTSTSAEVTEIRNKIEFVNTWVPDEQKVPRDGTKTQLNQIRLKEWDYRSSKWVSSPQCQKIVDRPPTYDCGRVATYAILFTSRVIPSAAALWTVSIIGAVLSVVFLLATIVIYLSNRELRDNPTTATLMNICGCLIALYFLFAVGIHQVTNKDVCNALTFLLHYSALTCVSWMTVNGIQMYKAFTTLHAISSRTRPLVYVLVYGIPLALVFINFAVTVLYFDKHKDQSDIYFESLYRAKYVCWLQPPSFHWGFLLPLGLLLLFNYAVFAFLLKRVVFRKRKIRSTAKGQAGVDRLFNAITMATMMGLTWVFGYLTLVPSDVYYQSAMQWLFAIFNVFQGILIFYLYCLRRENVRKIWLCCERKKKPPFLLTPTVNKITNTRDYSEDTL